jgi:hypothetical protein
VYKPFSKKLLYHVESKSKPEIAHKFFSLRFFLSLDEITGSGPAIDVERERAREREREEFLDV